MAGDFEDFAEEERAFPRYSAPDRWTDGAARARVRIRLAPPAVRGRAESAPAPDDEPAIAQRPDEEVYVVAAEVKSIGDTPLVNHKVRILDPDTGRAVSAVLTTDAAGIVRAAVPENKEYRIEILDEEYDAHPLEHIPDDEAAVLLCHFVDESGAPLANLGVEGSLGDEKFQLVTDDDGKIEATAQLASYELRVGDQIFRAHALLPRDRERDEHRYRFVVGFDPGAEDPSAAEHEYHLPDEHFDPEAAELA